MLTESGLTVDNSPKMTAARPARTKGLPKAYAPTRDVDIRAALRRLVSVEHAGEPDTAIVMEFAIYGGQFRADLVALNGLSHGYEIKSDLDTLERLPRQMGAYGDVFERATFVAVKRHIEVGESLLPAWWGIIQVDRDADGQVTLKRERPSLPNPRLNAIAIAALLWRGEALAILESEGLAKGIRSKPMDVLMERLAASVSADRLGELARRAMRARAVWITAQQQP